MKNLELLSPAGNMEKLLTVLHFGADAVYLSGKSYGLRAFGDNFDNDEMVEAINLVHEAGKKAYVTVNIFAHNADFLHLAEYLQFLNSAGADALIVSDPGIIYLAKKTVPELELHLSTQANTTNKYSAKFWAEQGVSRIVLARELSIPEIKEIRDFLPSDIELEAFVHGAMCMSYSGRCLLSNYLAGRPSNKGECSQSCRWEYSLAQTTPQIQYALCETKRPGEFFQIEEDTRGAYILNSKDLCMIAHLDKLIDAGIQSFKIEGRVKSAYYAGVITGAYRRALDIYKSNIINNNSCKLPEQLLLEPFKTSHRNFTTGFFFGEGDLNEYSTSRLAQSHEFSALVLARRGSDILVEMRNRFKEGDILEVVSPSKFHNSQLLVSSLRDIDGNPLKDAFRVQQKLLIHTDLELTAGDMLRKAIPNP